MTGKSNRRCYNSCINANWMGTMGGYFPSPSPLTILLPPPSPPPPHTLAPGPAPAPPSLLSPNFEVKTFSYPYWIQRQLSISSNRWLPTTSRNIFKPVLDLSLSTEFTLSSSLFNVGRLEKSSIERNETFVYVDKYKESVHVEMKNLLFTGMGGGRRGGEGLKTYIHTFKCSFKSTLSLAKRVELIGVIWIKDMEDIKKVVVVVVVVLVLLMIGSDSQQQLGKPRLKPLTIHLNDPAEKL